MSSLQMFSAWRRVDRNARRVVENHGFDGDWRLESLVTMGEYLSKKTEWGCKRTGEVQVISEDLS